MFLATTTSVHATEQFQLSFELIQSEKMLERGMAFVSQKPRTWSKGLQRSYLRLRCRQQESGKIQKSYSTEDHFAGLRVSHQLAGDKVELTVVRNVIQPRLIEIRALSRSECTDMSPIVSTTTQTYSVSAKDGVSESRPFAENMAFRIKLQSIKGKH